ncbi:methionine adenosyltransferase [bacterium]|nr:methionine adenosyltransferase [bacterium]
MGYFFSSESVSEGHPDKICDQISDAILDAALSVDPDSRVAAEVFTTTGLILIGGEIRSRAQLNYQDIARETARSIGYTNPDYGLDAESCAVVTTVHGQSADIAQGVDENNSAQKEIGAGDQGMMFGYACTQTDALMPLPIYLSHKLVKKLAGLRKSGGINYLRPDAKAQVTVEYEGRTPKRIDAVVISTQHDPDIDPEKIRRDMVAEVVRSEIPDHLLDNNTRYYINPTGRFVIGGPHGDTGLTGRKIIVDTYGGWASHGGGAFSGKDYTKVDRSGAYMARYIAKNIVAAGIAEEIEIQLAYAIGVSHPISVHVNTRGTAQIPEEEIVRLIQDQFDLTPAGIVKTLDLKKPIFKQTAAYGHFGRNDLDLAWERTSVSETLKRAVPGTAVTK